MDYPTKDRRVPTRRPKAPLRRAALCCAIILTLAACAHPTASTYGSRDLGQVIETAPGQVVSSRLVQVQGDKSTGVGPLAGATVGATTGAIVVRGKGGALAAVIGGLIGAGAGYLAEQEARRRKGIEYLIRMDDGRVVTLVQNRDGQEQPIENGQRVLVQYGADYSRVVPAPPAAGGGSPGGWQNPDDLTDDEAPFYNQDSFGDQQSS